jgi:lipoprotein-releasing system permease protein
VVLGVELARTLGVFVGDTVALTSAFGDLGLSGSQPRTWSLRVVALFRCGTYEYDSKSVYLDLAAAQAIVGRLNGISGLKVWTRHEDEARFTMRQVLAHLADESFVALDWGALNRTLLSALTIEKIVMAVILGIILLVANFIIVATLIMLGLEKRREIAILRCMGASRASVMKVFVMLGLAIGGLGAVLGTVLGLESCYVIGTMGVPLDSEVYYLSHVPVQVRPAQCVLIVAIAIATSYLAAIYPAIKGSDLEPIEALREE